MDHFRINRSCISDVWFGFRFVAWNDGMPDSKPLNQCIRTRCQDVRKHRVLASLAVLVMAVTVAAEEPAATPTLKPAVVAEAQSLEFFEKQVRPLLVEHCQSCHGAKKQEAGLRLDTATGLIKGSDSGPVVAAGDAEASSLIAAVRYNGDTKMPPKGKLPDRDIEILATWVKKGALWPAETVSADDGSKRLRAERAREHWAFQPLRPSAIPQTVHTQSGTSPVDAFLLARLESAGLKPNPRASRPTLIRRATFDLHGLPPTPDEVAAFEVDDSPDTFNHLVNRLLDSPRYGERWGRHWLDVARYSDTKGYVRLKDNPLYPAAWTYRDYVIRAFNEDLPFDTFVMQQLAADLLEPETDPGSLAAMGFLTLGQRFINSQHDIIDDRIDVVTRGLLGLTVTCARCHDHKFDPVPTRDYYSLHGVFANSLEPHVPPLIVPPAELARYDAYRKELQIRTDKFQKFMQTQQARFETSFRLRAGDYLLAAQHEKVQANFLSTMFLIDATKDLNPVVTQRWARLLGRTRQQHDPVLAPWHALSAMSTASTVTGFPGKAGDLIAQWRDSADPARPLNSLVIQVLAASPPRDMADVAARYGSLFQEADARWQQAVKADPTTVRLTDPAWEEVRQFLYGPDAPSVVTPAEVEEFLFVDATTQNQFHDQQRQVEDWIASAGAAPHAHILVDAAVPVDSHVFLRGNASNPGEAVPRQFLEALSHGERRPFQSGSGRLELARAIVARDNPLTARVLVNRVWMHHFGAGLVRTPGDFGLRGDPPTHPELLDDLARRFMDDGWSIKALHRLVMQSAVYQQQSRDNVSAREHDPENLLLGKMNRRRLDWESLRDSLLAVSGQLDLTMGGPSTNLFTPPYSSRRSVYGFIDRQNLPSVLRTFDFVPPDATSPGRHQTTVPQQALFLMNSPFLKQQVQSLAARRDLLAKPAANERIEAVHRLLFGRPATREEISLGITYLTTPSSLATPPAAAGAPAYLTPWEEYIQALLLSNEFAFVD
jgi:mono/diheme cytochrome c family protein